MRNIKENRIEELPRFGFENHDKIYVKKLRASEINVHKDSGTFYVYVSEFVHEDFISEMTRISNALLADRHDVNIMMLTFEEKEMWDE